MAHLYGERVETEELLARAVTGVLLVCCGLLLLWTARAAAHGRLPRNRLAGIRTRATMASDEAWLIGHQAARRLGEWAGGCFVAAGAVAAMPGSPWVFVGAALLATVVAIALVLRAGVVASKAAHAHHRTTPDAQPSGRRDT
ncbi:MAG TPA: SdpI family protein [Beutenbergiaceae bacterium]|nr:SdpI family protein [Beutenbergiaceae bacterium]